MSYSFSIDSLKINIQKFLYWMIYIFSEKLIWLLLIIIGTFGFSYSVISSNPSELFNFVVRDYVFIPLSIGMLISVGVMVPFIICCEMIPYYFHIKNFTNNCRKNRIKYQDKIYEVLGCEPGEIIKRNITDIYNLYMDVTQNRKKRKEATFSFKKHLSLDYQGARDVKIISEIKSFSKRTVICVTRMEEQFGKNNLLIHAFESIYAIEGKRMRLKKINYIGGRNI